MSYIEPNWSHGFIGAAFDDAYLVVTLLLSLSREISSCGCNKDKT